MRAKLPFSIGQIGKAFRNEITPGNFTFRTIEFEQMEFQTFCKEGSDAELYDYFKAYGRQYFEDLGLAPRTSALPRPREASRITRRPRATSSPCSCSAGARSTARTTARISTFTKHQEYSGQKMEYLDPETNEKFILFIIESTHGLDRTVLALLAEAYDEEVLDAEKNDVRVVLRLNPAVAPYKAAVLLLSKKSSGAALEVYDRLSKRFMVDFDETGSIGKRYRREDEIGTPFCITYDFDSAEDGCVTIRDRDTMAQERVPIDALEAYLAERTAF